MLPALPEKDPSSAIRASLSTLNLFIDIDFCFASSKIFFSKSSASFLLPPPVVPRTIASISSGEIFWDNTQSLTRLRIVSETVSVPITKKLEGPPIVSKKGFQSIGQNTFCFRSSAVHSD